MVPEIDIWRSAQLLIKQHGKEAGLKADLRVSELTKKGDTTGADVWKLIRSAIEKLQNESCASHLSHPGCIKNADRSAGTGDGTIFAVRRA